MEVKRVGNGPYKTPAAMEWNGDIMAVNWISDEADQLPDA
jgi:hypothetical protein